MASVVDDINLVLHDIRAANPEDKAHAVAQAAQELRTELAGFWRCPGKESATPSSSLSWTALGQQP